MIITYTAEAAHFIWPVNCIFLSASAFLRPGFLFCFLPAIID